MYGNYTLVLSPSVRMHAVHSLYKHLSPTIVHCSLQPMSFSRLFFRSHGLPTVVEILRARLFWGVCVHNLFLLEVVEHDSVRLYMDGLSTSGKVGSRTSALSTQESDFVRRDRNTCRTFGLWYLVGSTQSVRPSFFATIGRVEVRHSIPLKCARFRYNICQIQGAFSIITYRF